MMAEANAAIETISASDAMAISSDANVIFIDVRESVEQAKGMIPGAVAVPRGFLEFRAHPQSPLYNPEIDGSKKLVLYCASGGRSALAGKTLKDLGYDKVSHIAGGISAWQEAGGPISS